MKSFKQSPSRRPWGNVPDNYDFAGMRKRVEASKKRDLEAARIGRTYAGCYSGSCYIGVVVGCFKGYFKVKTRAGNFVKVAYGTVVPEGWDWTYEKWDETLLLQPISERANTID